MMAKFHRRQRIAREEMAVNSKGIYMISALTEFTIYEQMRSDLA